MRSAFSRPDRDFAAILDSLEQDGLCDFFRPVAGVERFWPGEAGVERLGAAAVAKSYAENQDDEPPTRARSCDAKIPDFGMIAAEIARSRNAEELRALRRALARATHPDRLPVERRAEADRFLAQVNAAIDVALSRR